MTSWNIRTDVILSAFEYTFLDIKNDIFEILELRDPSLKVLGWKK